MQLLNLRKWFPIALLLLILLAGLAFFAPTLARAHAQFDHSEPLADALLAHSPAKVQIWFTQELFRRAGANTLAVFGPNGTQVDRGDAHIDDDDRTHVLVSLPTDLPDGRYTVRWHSVSLEDGDEESGEFSFSVGTAAARAPAVTSPVPAAAISAAEAESTAPDPVAPGGSSLPCLNGLILGLLALGVIVISPKGNTGASQ